MDFAEETKQFYKKNNDCFLKVANTFIVDDTRLGREDTPYNSW